uniref:VWFC domain-containing protein n=1 Tax=Leptobrachium leishanense TaxID=445787 RepID=A0A8C5LZQ8_9ANUR
MHVMGTNNTEWKPDSCMDCACYNDIVICENTNCRDPQCDFSKGEILRLEQNKCCPECASQSHGYCQYEGKVHAHGTQWTASECTVCTCMNGKVTCAPKSCRMSRCKKGEIEHLAPGECCPKCVGTGDPCFLGGQLLRDGEERPLSQCSKCSCKNGATLCFTMACPPLLCDKDETLAVIPGKCCPECLPKSCAVSGKTYEHGVQWQRNDCTTCICDRGNVRCHTNTCYPLTLDPALKSSLLHTHLMKSVN